MKLRTRGVMSILRMLSAAAFVDTSALEDEEMARATAATDSGATPDTRYGLFNGLDHRSWYNQGNFPEPFLVDDSGLEINKTRLDWLHTVANGQQSDIA